jgi:uncharacterized membrane protein YhaH (DUF805 family)
MNFGQAISSGFRNYVNFSGRAARSEYWLWILFVVIVSIVTAGIDMAIFRDPQVLPINSLTGLALLLPNLAVAVRRLHDTDRSGWWLLLLFLPLIGAIVLIIWFCFRGTPGQNRFGPDPLAGDLLTPPR